MEGGHWPLLGVGGKEHPEEVGGRRIPVGDEDGRIPVAVGGNTRGSPYPERAAVELEVSEMRPSG